MKDKAPSKSPFLGRIKLCLLQVIGKLEHYNAKQLAEDGGHTFVSMDDSRNRSLAEASVNVVFRRSMVLECSMEDLI